MTEVICDNDFYVFPCPHCLQYVIVNKKETNCCIFRHAVYKHNFTQINPHASKQQCENLITSGSVIGCAKPFRLVGRGNQYFVEECDYI